MKIYTSEKIEQNQINYQAIKEQSKAVLFERKFVRRKDFPQQFREHAFHAFYVCQRASLNCFLVETSFLLTLWTEEQA
ncbi:MAG: hypothetical protein AB4041_01265 [Microcystaceae cyanobacterium]